jgi:diguanylate cyclase (GGDEF)-like protein/PAS domain S-box-containing protein
MSLRRDAARPLAEISPVAHVEIDLTAVVLQWNPAAEDLTGYAADEVVGRVLPAAIRSAGLPGLLAELAGRMGNVSAPGTLRLRCRHRSGRTVHLEVRAIAVRDSAGIPCSLVIAASDVGTRVQRERDLQFQATHDALTQLPNRELLLRRLDQALATGTRLGENTGLLIVDLEKFGAVNSALGRAAGDQLLAQVGPRLLPATLRSRDLVARLSRDEFAVLLPGVESVPVAIEVGERMLGALGTPFAVDGTRIDVGASIGIAVAPEHGGDAAQLLQHADTAMYEAKEADTEVAVYRPDLEDRALAQFGLLGELRRALDQHELVVHYQPKVDVATGSWASTEALVRWQHPQRGLVPPGDFIPLLETSGLINRLTDYVLDAAIAQVRRWADRGIRVPVAVNLSARSLHDHTLPGRVMAALVRHGVPADLLCLEITETAIMHDPESALEVLSEFVYAGIGLSLDDFGTGYSSMSYLQRLPVGELKVDRTFVMGLARARADRALVRMAIDLGHSMGLKVVAEGVEDAETLAQLHGLGCDVAQGYYLGRPMPAADVDRWFDARRHTMRAAGWPAGTVGLAPSMTPPAVPAPRQARAVSEGSTVPAQPTVSAG